MLFCVRCLKETLSYLKLYSALTGFCRFTQYHVVKVETDVVKASEEVQWQRFSDSKELL